MLVTRLIPNLIENRFVWSPTLLNWQTCRRSGENLKFENLPTQIESFSIGIEP